MPVHGLHHLDLAVVDVERSVAFYLALLGPLGLREKVRYPSYRGTEVRPMQRSLRQSWIPTVAGVSVPE